MEIYKFNQIHLSHTAYQNVVEIHLKTKHVCRPFINTLIQLMQAQCDAIRIASVGPAFFPWARNSLKHRVNYLA